MNAVSTLPNPLPPPGAIDALNRECFCITLDHEALARALDSELGQPGLSEMVRQRCPYLFAAQPVFVAAPQLQRIAQVIQAVESVVALPAYREEVLAAAPAIARVGASGPRGAFFGYDFHLDQGRLGLIEINTNAGGAFLNAALARAQRACCSEAHVPFEISPAQDFGSKIVDMFIDEWRRQRGSGRPTMIAIVDDAPEEQYLFPEFRLAKALLEKYGFVTVIADAKELLLDGKKLLFGGRPIDLVYNRLVDFALAEPRHAALQAAYVGGDIVVTPNPRAHALFADKRNLTLLSNADSLKHWGLTQSHLDVLRVSVPTTVIVSPDNADALWRDRRNLFFKPARGHGSKAAYRGDKVTRKVWAEIVGGEYVAQSYEAPGTRSVQLDETREELKVDVRLYTFAGTILLAAARLYQGQTTNMRTPGGGFAPVLEVRTPLERS